MKSTFVSALLAFIHLVDARPKNPTAVTSTPTATGPPIGAKSTDVLAPSIPNLPPGPNASSYPRNGKLNAPQPAPYTPSGGLGQNGSEPNYQVKSDFDFESLVSRLLSAACVVMLILGTVSGTLSRIHRT